MDELKLKMYQRVYQYAKKILALIKNLPKDYGSQILGRQLVRSGTSVAANIIEAKAASSKKDYINFFHYALKSANESKLWLALLRDTDEKNGAQIKELLKETVEIANILAASILTMKNKR